MQEKEVFFTDDFYPKAKNVETKRFIYAVEKLVNEGKIKSFKAIAENAGFSSQDFTDQYFSVHAIALAYSSWS